MTLAARSRDLASRGGILWGAATLLTFLAGAIHLLACPEHLTEAPLLGWGLLATGLAQLAAGTLFLMRPSTTLARLLFVGTVLALAIFVVQHTVGVPGFAHADVAAVVHPHAEGVEHRHGSGGREPLGVASVIIQLALIVALLPLLRRPTAHVAWRTAEPV
jgi:hypothetical protein